MFVCLFNKTTLRDMERNINVLINLKYLKQTVTFYAQVKIKL